jgi:hypothetical protein
MIRWRHLALWTSLALATLVGYGVGFRPLFYRW